jgi:hypothetical protein
VLKTLILRAGVLAVTLSLATSAPAQNTAADKKSAAQNSSDQKEDTKTVTNGGTSQTNADIVYGKVEGYEPGRSIKVSVPGIILTSKTFDLTGKDLTAKVPGSVKVGDWVHVHETTDKHGRKAVTVSPSTEKAAAKAKQS